MIRENDYLFASSFVRASERGGGAKERIEKLLSASSIEILCKGAAEIFGVEESEGLEAILGRALKRCVDTVTSSVPDPSVYAPLLYKYDCNNIKTAIKCVILEIDCEAMLTPVATIPADVIISAAKTGDFKKIKGKMGHAAAQAMETYLKTGEARAIDLILDRACFEDMKESAQLHGIPMISKIVSAMADKANILTFIRIMAMNMPRKSADALLRRALVCGGDIPLSAFKGELSDVKNNLDNCIFVKAFAEIVNNSSRPAMCEKILDEAILALVSDVKFKAFGPEVPLRHLLVCEAEIMNCRIAARALAEGLDKSEARERMRFAYV